MPKSADSAFITGPAFQEPAFYVNSNAAPGQQGTAEPRGDRRAPLLGRARAASPCVALSWV